MNGACARLLWNIAVAIQDQSTKGYIKRMRLHYLFAVILVVSGVPDARATDEVDRLFEFEYRVSLRELRGQAKVWIPVPQDTRYQGIVNLEVDTDANHSFVTDAVYGNRFVLIEGDEGKVDATITFAVERQRRTTPSGEVSPLTAIERSRYLAPSSMVIIDGVVREEADRIAGNAPTPYTKARSLYDHIVNTVRYDKSGKGWGRGDAVYACDSRAGNCTDFHSLFIGEARSLGVPSRFLMGFSIPRDKSSGKIGGYHCWAEFHEDGNGWIPLDASEAFKDQTRREELFGGLDADRVQFTMGRDITLPGMAGKPLNFAIYPYAEVDGKPHEDIEYSFGFRDQEPTSPIP